MVSSVTYVFLAACFVLTHQLPTSPVRPAEEGSNKPYGSRISEPPVPSTFDKLPTDSSTKRNEQLQTSTGSSLTYNHRENNNENNKAPVRPYVYNPNPVPSQKPLANPSQNPPSIKTVRETPIDSFKAHEAASSLSSRTTETAKISGSSSTTVAPKKNDEERVSSTLNKDSKPTEEINRHISGVQRIPAIQHHAIKRDDTFAKIFVEDPYVLDFEPESSLTDGKKFRALPAFMG